MKNRDQLQRSLIRVLAKRAERRAPKDDLAFMSEQELEAIVWGYPDDPSEPLVLFALMTHPNSPGKAIPEEEFAAWMSACSSRLCLEWLRRRGAVIRYEVSPEGAAWHTDTLKLTAGFLEDLKGRHPTLHLFAAYVMRHALGLQGSLPSAQAN